MKALNISFFLLFTVQCLFAQKVENPSSKDSSAVPQTHTAYLGIAYGVQHAVFRDFATSPLFYIGSPSYVGLSHVDLDAQRESSIRLAYAFGDFRASGVQQGAVSAVDMLSMEYLELFQLSRFSSSKVNIKIGGLLKANVNIRDNEALGNNSDGYEVIANLMGSVKGTIDLTSKEANLRSAHAVHLPKRKSTLAIGLNVGMVNSSYRNGFIYTRQSPLLNQDDINEGYQFQLFAGYRVNTTVDYTTCLNNGNAIRLSYRWDAYHTGGDYEAFEMATHLLSLSFMFNLKAPR